MAVRRLSSLVHGQKNEAFDASLGNEVLLAKLGYEQGMWLWAFYSLFLPHYPSLTYHSLLRTEAFILPHRDGGLQLLYRHLLDRPGRNSHRRHCRWRSASHGLVLARNLRPVAVRRLFLR